MRPADDVCVVRALGEVDLTTVADLDSALRQVQGNGDANVVLDLWDVTFIDSVGLGVLLSAKRRAQKGIGGFAVIAEPGGPVQTVFDLAGLTDSLPIFATRALAASTLRSGRSQAEERRAEERVRENGNR